MLFGVLSSSASMSYSNKSKNKLNTSVIEKSSQNFSDYRFFKAKPLDLKEKTDDMLIIKVILCFFISPLAVFLHVGIGTQFWINLILYLLLIVPGMIHGLLVVLDVI
jgi:uncharacterized membrane protein YqaE (UPF0057 family)